MVSEDRKDAQRRRDIGVRGSKEIRLNQKKGDRQKIPEGRKAVQNEEYHYWNRRSY